MKLQNGNWKGLVEKINFTHSTWKIKSLFWCPLEVCPITKLIKWQWKSLRANFMVKFMVTAAIRKTSLVDPWSCLLDRAQFLILHRQRHCLALSKYHLLAPLTLPTQKDFCSARPGSDIYSRHSQVLSFRHFKMASLKNPTHTQNTRCQRLPSV